MRSAPTLRDVAQAAGVSTSTASRVLNGATNVAADLAERVRRAADALGYSADVLARAMRGRQDSIALLASDVSTEAVREFATAMELAALQIGAVSTVSAAGGHPFDQLEALRVLRSMRPRALIVTGRWVSAPEIAAPLAEELDDFRDDGGRAVIIGRPLPGYSSIGFDDRGVGRDLGRHMGARAGAESAVILTGDPAHHAFRDRARGFVEGLGDRGIRDIRFVPSTVSREAGSEALVSALEHGVPDLVLGGNDWLALGALEALEARGIGVPDDVSVSGVDDIPVSRDVTPSLTTAALPFAEAGAEAVRLAVQESHVPVRLLLPGRLVIRASSRSSS